MRDRNLTFDQELEVESHAPYLKVWFGLLIFTVIEYFYAYFFKDTFMTLILGLMLCAAIKAAMVGWYFMHLKFEGKWVYALLIPAGCLAAVFILALVPDIALKLFSDEATAEPDENMAAVVAPLVSGPISLRS